MKTSNGNGVFKKRVLIVDDDRDNVFILNEILGMEFETKSVFNGELALETANDFKPDVILLDIVMPGLDGYEVCRRFRQNQGLAFTKIILLSGKSMLDDRLKGYEAGADDFITKPFDSEELLAKVRVFIRLKSVQEIDRMKDDLINLFSHETRTPLNAILGFAKILGACDKYDEYEKECVKHIISSGKTLLELVNKAILLCNLRNGKRTLFETKTDFETIIKKAADSVQDKIREKNIILLKDLNNVSQSFNADEELLVAALTYVLENAVKFSPYLGAVEISVRKNQDGIACDIRDNGKGLEKWDQADKLFGGFYVGDLEHHGRGHGLSLVIVKHIMILHGGTVSAVNNINEPGCTFTIFIPDSLYA
jgi:signal transduction histidine kinase